MTIERSDTLRIKSREAAKRLSDDLGIKTGSSFSDDKGYFIIVWSDEPVDEAPATFEDFPVEVRRVARKGG